MAMVANDPAAAKRLGIPQKVGKEFVTADKGRKFSKGGETMATKKMAVGGMSGRAMPSQANAGGASRGLDRAASMSGRTFSKGGVAASKMGAVKAGGNRPHGEHSVQQKGHTRGKQVVMAGGKGMKKGGRC